MKQIIALLFIFISTTAFARSSYNSPDYRVTSQTFRLANAEYRCFLTAAMIKSSLDKKLTASTISLSEIIAKAEKKLSKIDANAEWRLAGLNLYQSNYQNQKFWYFNLNFRTKDNKYAYMLLTLDGKICKVIKIAEQEL